MMEAMAGSVFVVAWDEDAALDLAERLSEAGWMVALEHTDGGRAWKRIKEGRPDVVVVDMTRRPSHSRELLRAMGQRKYTQTIPVVRIGGDDGVALEEVVDAVGKAASDHS
jgi:DNA-binding NtrC family response regulator